MKSTPVSCLCGTVRGLAHDLRPATVNRCVCYCKFCATYADVLGRSEEMLDERRGSDIFNFSPRQLELTDGIDEIACLRLTDSGALRYYARCCNTPLINAIAGSRIPFMGVSPLIVRWDEIDETRDDLLGPIRAGVNGSFKGREAAELRHTKLALAKMLARFGVMILRWRLRGDHAKSPFVDGEGRPIVPAVRVTRDTRLERPPE